LDRQSTGLAQSRLVDLDSEIIVSNISYGFPVRFLWLAKKIKPQFVHQQGNDSRSPQGTCPWSDPQHQPEKGFKKKKKINFLAKSWVGIFFLSEMGGRLTSQ